MRLFACWLTLATCHGQLTPAQREVIETARQSSIDASTQAENEILAVFSTTSFRWELKLQGAAGRRLASLSATELLERLKVALQNLEWVTNFGLDANSLKSHPGESAFSIKTLDAFGGRFPTMWELKATNSSIVANVSQDQWGVMEAAETGLYRLPPFSKVPPSPEEARERPRYLAGNTRQLAMGVRRYGSISAILRNDVIRQRAVIVGSDTGGWESICNKSVTPVHKPSWFAKLVEDASVSCARVERTPLGVAERPLHSFLANARTFRKVGGGLARQIYQLLGEDADVRPLEGNMYMEAALLGEMRVNDTKVLVGSFPGLFGSKMGEDLRKFCSRHGMPLVWSLSDGQEWTKEEEEKLDWLPWEPFEYWHSDGERLLDPIAGWAHTSQPSSGGSAKTRALWEKVWAEVAKQRSQLPHGHFLTQSSMKSWWKGIKSSDLPVQMLREGECSPNLCFGTILAGGNRTCICRADAVHAGELMVI